jgi:hypothetical protein
MAVYDWKLWCKTFNYILGTRLKLGLQLGVCLRNIFWISTIHFVVMGDMFCAELRIHRRFNLKGSSLGRSTDEIEIDEHIFPGVKFYLSEYIFF